MEISSKHSRTIYVGDIHQKFPLLGYDIKHLDISDALIICLGDIGLGFDKIGHHNKELEDIQKIVKKKNSTLLLFRGNHDNPDFFNKDLLDKQDNIIIAEDYSIINQNGIKSLIVGGGISIDRETRLKNHTKKLNKKRKYGSSSPIKQEYWEGEDIVLDLSKVVDLEDISILLTHIAPPFTFPIDKLPLELDLQLISDERDSRNKLKIIYDELSKKNTITNWYYGHYHDDYIDHIGECYFRGIDMNKLYEEMNYIKK